MTTPPAPHASPSRQIGWRRIAVPSTWAAVILAAVTALATTAASVIAGRLAEHTSARLVTLLAVTVLGGALVDTAGRFLWAGMVDRAAGQLRRDLVDAVLAQPLEALSEQAGGEILDRVDDDTHEISNLLRQQIWMVLRMTLAMVPMWIVAGITWWPAWVLFPLFAALTWVLMRSLLAPIAAGKVLEEAAWTEHAAIFEEGVAGRDDIRTSLGQPFVVARLAKLSARVHERFLAVVRLEVKLLLRTGLSLHLLLVLVVLAGVALAGGAHDADGHHAQGAGLPFDDAEAAPGQPGVHAEHSHLRPPGSTRTPVLVETTCRRRTGRRRHAGLRTRRPRAGRGPRRRCRRW